MKKSNELEQLKQRLFQSKDNIINNLMAVMETCGGYIDLMELPIPTYFEILKELEKQQSKSHNKKKW